MNQLETAQLERDVLTTSEGASARCVEFEQREQLEVRDANQQLVFRFDPQTGQATLNVPQGNLRLVCETGDIELEAAGAIRTRSEQVDIEAREKLSLSVLSNLGRCISRLFVDRANSCV